MARSIDEMPEAYRRRMSQTEHKFKIGEHEYQCHALMPLEQIHMARRLAPIMLAALKPEDGRKAILGRLMKLASLAEANSGASVQDADAVVNDALDLATSIFSAAAATDEEMVNAIIRKVMTKVMRRREGGGAMVCWETKFDVPTYPDMDGFLVMTIVIRYLIAEFRGQIAEYVASLNLKPSPALMAAAGMGQRPPGAPNMI